ncbi:hypothetical protein [Methylibium sp. Root1272]|uniref:hypothetical protein n=1 Tax=Methylibium sp. Root1272 TaxID=1736441 RepID=UPI0007014A94|nr:hypothetical protein [Methylibium sp. Root1272]KQW70107.1 hypothetical protein ASC67_06415 [Methylibium sp. Root1272]
MAKKSKADLTVCAEFDTFAALRDWADRRIKVGPDLVGEFKSDGSDEAVANGAKLKMFADRVWALTTQDGFSEIAIIALKMAYSELLAKRHRFPQDIEHSAKVWRAIDAMWCAMRATDDQRLRSKIRAISRELCSFSDWPRSDWPGVA